MAIVVAVARSKTLPSRVVKTQMGMECRASILTLTFGTTGTAQL